MAMSRQIPSATWLQRYQEQDPDLQMIVKSMAVEADSQFRALAHELEGKEDRHRRVRDRVVTHIANNREYFEPILEQLGQDFDSYVRYMRLLRSPGDVTTLLAASREYQVVIVVLYDNCAPSVIFDPNLQLGPSAMHVYLSCHQATQQQDQCYDVVMFSRGQEWYLAGQEQQPQPPAPVVARETRHRRDLRDLPQMPRRIWKACCKGCNQDDNDDTPCATVFCAAWQRGQCARGTNGEPCEHGLCHATEGGYKGEYIRNVPALKCKRGRKKQAQTTNLALMEQAQQSLLAANGVVVKNGFYDVATEQETCRAPRGRSCDHIRSKDPRCRQSCHLCINDVKLKRERATKLYVGRVAMLAVSGMLDLCTGPEVAPEFQQMMAFSRDYIRPRSSGGIFDPLNMLLLCEKDLCKHWLRGECKSGDKCKFSHCYPGDLTKDAM